MSAEERARIVERYRKEIERLESEGRHWEVNRARRETRNRERGRITK